MAYADGEALILTQVQACASFNTKNATRANWKPLKSGRSRQYAILSMGAFEREHHGMGGTYRTQWMTLCEVWVRYIDDSTSLTTLEAKTAEIVERFDAYRLAGDTTGTIQDVFARRGSRPQEMRLPTGKGPSWLMQEIEIVWLEQRTVTLQE
jgi:hypothetical protein